MLEASPGPGAQMAANTKRAKRPGSWITLPLWPGCMCSQPLALQCPEAAMLWDRQANGVRTPDNVTLSSSRLVCWRAPDGTQWKQVVQQVVKNMKRQSNNKYEL